jgi:hypothetical protein
MSKKSNFDIILNELEFCFKSYFKDDGVLTQIYIVRFRNLDNVKLQYNFNRLDHDKSTISQKEMESIWNQIFYPQPSNYGAS